MLNLTPEPITLIAGGGKVRIIEPSGYVARVAYERVECDYFPVAKDDMTGEILKHYVPIIEQRPREIALDGPDAKAAQQFLVDIIAAEESTVLLLVAREVAEAAAYIHPHYPWPHSCPSACHKTGADHKFDDRCDEPHPLASRMVWCCDPIYRDNSGHLDESEALIGYRELRRVAGVAR